ncbi:MAG: hypothetical protein HYV09_17110 [Deltaproteobacteria bacterium]|nr:hypothetical protein [Deltaproteobacteria bacterium]
MKRASLVISCMTVVGLAACAAPREAQAPKRAEEPAPAASAPAPTVEPTGEAVEPTPAAPAGGGGVAPTTKAPTAAPGATGTVVLPSEIAQAQVQLDEASKAFAASTGDCVALCKALHSMTHATERLCGLVAGGSPTDVQRCTDARSRLESAQAKVKASCGNACSAP